MAGPFISFLTDFGGESAPAVCRGVIWSIAADARILDLNHHVRKFAVRDGAFLLSRAVGYLPVGVHLAVVDPGVGTPRRPIAIQTMRGDHPRRARQRSPPTGRDRARWDRRGAGADQSGALPAPGLEHVPRPRPLRADRRAPRRGRPVRDGRARRRPVHARGPRGAGRRRARRRPRFGGPLHRLVRQHAHRGSARGPRGGRRAAHQRAAAAADRRGDRRQHRAAVGVDVR